MKTLLFPLLTSLALFLSLGCNDDDGALVPANNFTTGASAYLTPRAYLILDDGPPFQNQYGFAFLNGELREDNVNGSSVSTETTQGGVVWVKNGPGTVASEQAVLVNVGTHALNDESLVFTAVQGFSNTYNYGAKTWGDVDIAGADMIEIGQAGSGTITINSVAIDYGLRTGTVDMSYSFTDGTTTVSGSFNGPFGIINEF